MGGKACYTLLQDAFLIYTAKDFTGADTALDKIAMFGDRFSYLIAQCSPKLPARPPLSSSG